MSPLGSGMALRGFPALPDSPQLRSTVGFGARLRRQFLRPVWCGVSSHMSTPHLADSHSTLIRYLYTSLRRSRRQWRRRIRLRQRHRLCFGLQGLPCFSGRGDFASQDSAQSSRNDRRVGLPAELQEGSFWTDFVIFNDNLVALRALQQGTSRRHDFYKFCMAVWPILSLSFGFRAGTTDRLSQGDLRRDHSESFTAESVEAAGFSSCYWTPGATNVSSRFLDTDFSGSVILGIHLRACLSFDG